MTQAAPSVGLLFVNFDRLPLYYVIFSSATVLYVTLAFIFGIPSSNTVLKTIE